MTYESNIDQVVVNISKMIDGFLENNDIVKEIATTIKASNLRRIHTDGKAVDESSIGKYDTKEIYVNPKNSPKKFTGLGKGGKTKFKSGRSHKTRYFKDGYKGFRAKIGRETSKVNLSLFGRLSKEFVQQQRGKDWVLGFSSEEANNKRLGNEKRFGKEIWGVSKADNLVIEEILKNARLK